MCENTSRNRFLSDNLLPNAGLEAEMRRKSHIENTPGLLGSELENNSLTRARKFSDLSVLPPISTTPLNWSRHMAGTTTEVKPANPLASHERREISLNCPAREQHQVSSVRCNNDKAYDRSLIKSSSWDATNNVNRIKSVSVSETNISQDEMIEAKGNDYRLNGQLDGTSNGKDVKRKVSRCRRKSKTGHDKSTKGKTSKVKLNKTSSNSSLEPMENKASGQPMRKLSQIDMIQLSEFGLQDMLQALDQAEDEEPLDEGYHEAMSEQQSTLARLTPAPEWECEYGGQAQNANPDEFGYVPKRCWCNRCQLMYDMHKNKDPDLVNWGRYPCYQW